jgi:NADH-quinone oxidoreductase subunit E
MLFDALRESLIQQIAQAEHPREKAIDVMCEIQKHYGYMSDEAIKEAAGLLGMTPLELEELATFYDFIFREPVGRYVIQLCDSAMCLINDYETVRDHLCARLQIGMGETSADGLFTLLPACCIGYCDRAPAMLINRGVYGYLTEQKIDEILDRLILEAKTS